MPPSSLCVYVCAQSCLIPETPQTVAHQAPLVHGILQARILEWVAMPFSKGSSQPSDRTQVSCIAGRFLTIQATWEAQPYTLIPISDFLQQFLWVTPRELQRSCSAGKEKSFVSGYKASLSSSCSVLLFKLMIAPRLRTNTLKINIAPDWSAFSNQQR